MLLPALLAFSLGIFPPAPNAKVGVIKAVIRHEGTPLPFEIQVRTKDDREADWLYVHPDRYEVFPGYLKTSASGRLVTIHLPSELQRYSQVCALHTPTPVPGLRFQLLLSLLSCQNVPRPTPASPRP